MSDAPRDGRFVTTFDRYLLSRYFHVFAVFFIAAMGLYVVADGFTNLDDFQQRGAKGGTAGMLAIMGQHYLYQSVAIFDMCGPTLAVMSTMCVLALALKQGEIHPLLAAGVPVYRLGMPFVVGVVSINALMTANEEWIIPRVADQLQAKHGETAADSRNVEPTYDTRWNILINGRELIPDRRVISAASFLLPRTLLAEAKLVRADEAEYVPERAGHPPGWKLTNAKPRFDDLRISELGKQVVLPQDDPNSLFICSELTFDQLDNRNTGFRYLSTQDLVWRIRHPSAGIATRRAQVLHLHERLTRPVLTLIGVFLVIPLVARKERFSLVSNLAVCMGVVGVVYALAQGMLLFGNTGLLAPTWCVWLPLIFGGGLCAWLTPLART
jgi:lipopolysaccharide export system permease protein